MSGNLEMRGVLTVRLVGKRWHVKVCRTELGTNWGSINITFDMSGCTVSLTVFVGYPLREFKHLLLHSSPILDCCLYLTPSVDEVSSLHPKSIDESGAG